MYSGPAERQKFKTSVSFTTLPSSPKKKGAVGTAAAFVSCMTEPGIPENQMLLHLYVVAVVVVSIFLEREITSS